jgi:ABC-2 type transport system ATP-binding protein
LGGPIEAVDNVIEIKDLAKKFGQLKALDNLNLTVRRGSVFGFLGPNGAGKTTTLRILMGLANPTSGNAWILDQDIRESIPAIRKRIGYLPDVPSFYNWMTGKEYLRFVGGLFDIPKKELDQRVGELLEFTDLAAVKTRIGGFSRGMKQRLGLAQALVNKPEVLFLDEPTSALDPIGRKEVLSLIGSLGEETTVFFSTHILGDVERVCDTIAILNQGKLVIESSLLELRSRYAKPVFLIEADTGLADLEKALKDFSWIEQIKHEGNQLRVKVNDVHRGQAEIPRIIFEANALLRTFEIMEPTLEDIFVEMIESK